MRLKNLSGSVFKKNLKLKEKMGFSITLSDLENIKYVKVKRKMKG